MARKEIIYLTGTQILIGMALLGNLLVAAFIYRYHAVELFRTEQRDLGAFTEAQHRERAVKEEIRKLEGKASWDETDFAIGNPWSADDESNK